MTEILGGVDSHFVDQDTAPNDMPADTFTVGSADVSDPPKTKPAEDFTKTLLTEGLLPISESRSKLAQSLGSKSTSEIRILITKLFAAEPTEVIQEGAAAGLLASLYINAEPSTASRIVTATKEALLSGDVPLSALARPVSVGYTGNANSALFDLVTSTGDPVLLAGYEAERKTVLLSGRGEDARDFLIYGAEAGISAAVYEELSGFQKLGIRTSVGRDQIDQIKEIAAIDDVDERNEAIKELLISNAGEDVKAVIEAIFSDPAGFAKSFLKDAAIGATPVIGQIYEAIQLGQAALQALGGLAAIAGLVEGISDLSAADTVQEREIALYGLVGSTRVVTEEVTGAVLDVVLTEAAVRGGRGVAKALNKRMSGKPEAPQAPETTNSKPSEWREKDIPRALDWNDYFGIKTTGEIKKEFNERYGLDPDYAQAGHDIFSHLLQPANEISSTRNLSDITDDVIDMLKEGKNTDQITKELVDFHNKVNAGGKWPMTSTQVAFFEDSIAFAVEQAERNAWLNGISVEEFATRIDNNDMTLLVQRPREHPLAARPR